MAELLTLNCKLHAVQLTAQMPDCCKETGQTQLDLVHICCYFPYIHRPHQSNHYMFVCTVRQTCVYVMVAILQLYIKLSCTASAVYVLCQ